jgi:DNA-binding MarR family transcriptional regulator
LGITVSSGEATALDRDVSELRQLLAEAFRNLKRAGGGMDELAPPNRAFLEAGLRDRLARLLLTVANTGPLTVSELASRMGLASATTSLLAGELQRAGFLDRREDDDDRRRTIVSLFEHLQAPLAQFANASAAPLRRTLEQLSATERSHLLGGLRPLAREAGDGGGL